MTIKDDLHEALKAGGLWLASSRMKIMEADPDILYIESAVIVKKTRTELVKPRKSNDPVPELVANCQCADWTYVAEMGEWHMGDHHPNCKRERHE